MKKSLLTVILKYILIGTGAILLLCLTTYSWAYLSFLRGPAAFEINDYHPFRSERVREKYLEYYDARAEDWPSDSEDKMITTSYGQTFVRINGSADDPPIVLLPGGGATSLIWKNNIEELSEDYRVYALDQIYDFGRSIYTRRMSGPEDYVKWLDELFTELGLENNINLVGYSYGGWVAGQFLVHYPHRLNKAVLLSPAYTVYPCSKEFEKRALTGLIPFRYLAKSALFWTCEDMVQTEDGIRMAEGRLDAISIAIRSFKPKIPISMTVIPNEELQHIIVPVLYLVGENEKLYSVKDAVDHLNMIAPDIQTEVIPNTGHCLLLTYPKIVSEKILEFLDQ